MSTIVKFAAAVIVVAGILALPAVSNAGDAKPTASVSKKDKAACKKQAAKKFKATEDRKVYIKKCLEGK